MGRKPLVVDAYIRQERTLRNEQLTSAPLRFANGDLFDFTS